MLKAISTLISKKYRHFFESFNTIGDAMEKNHKLYMPFKSPNNVIEFSPLFTRPVLGGVEDIPDSQLDLPL